jgi:hypothetical protein
MLSLGSVFDVSEVCGASVFAISVCRLSNVAPEHVPHVNHPLKRKLTDYNDKFITKEPAMPNRFICLVAKRVSHREQACLR